MSRCNVHTASNQDVIATACTSKVGVPYSGARQQVASSYGYLSLVEALFRRRAEDDDDDR